MITPALWRAGTRSLRHRSNLFTLVFRIKYWLAHMPPTTLTRCIKLSHKCPIWPTASNKFLRDLQASSRQFQLTSQPLCLAQSQWLLLQTCTKHLWAMIRPTWDSRKNRARTSRSLSFPATELASKSLVRTSDCLLNKISSLTEFESRLISCSWFNG